MQVIPIVVKTPALFSMAGVYGILSTWKKKMGRTGRSWAAEMPAAQQCCVALGVCRSAVSQAAWVGCAAELGASHPGPPAGHSLASSQPCSSRGWHGSFPHRTALPMESLCLGPSLLSMCSRTPSECFDRVWFSSFSGSCLPCSSCCSTALTKSCSEFSLGMRHHSLSALGCWSPPAHLKWFVIW